MQNIHFPYLHIPITEKRRRKDVERKGFYAVFLCTVCTPNNAYSAYIQTQKNRPLGSKRTADVKNYNENEPYRMVNVAIRLPKRLIPACIFCACVADIYCPCLY